MFKHILAPVDGSPFSAAAMRIAVDLAQLANAEVTFVHCSTPFDVFAVDPFMEVNRKLYETAAESAAQECLEVARKLARDAGVRASAEHVSTRFPWQGILETARLRGSDLIVMASHGRQGVAALLLGSETRKVLAHATLPVMVCR